MQRLKEARERLSHHPIILFLLFLALSLSQGEVNAQEADETLATWFRNQAVWDEDTIELMNEEVNQEYIELTGADQAYTLQQLIDRNNFYALWPDFAARERQYRADSDLRCLTASSHNAEQEQNFYLSRIDHYLFSLVMHENIHTDVLFTAPAEAYFLPENTQAWGFLLLENGSWSSTQLNYFEEAYAAVMSTKLMQTSGFTSFRSYGEYYEAGAEILDPLLTQAMEEQGITLPELWEMHSHSQIVEFFELLGRQILVNRGQSYDEEQAKLLGYELAQEIHAAIVSETEIAGLSSQPVGQYALGATCGMFLRFSESQMNEFNQQHGINSQNDFWFPFDDPYFPGDYHYIVEEDYYAITNL